MRIPVTSFHGVCGPNKVVKACASYKTFYAGDSQDDVFQSVPISNCFSHKSKLYHVQQYFVQMATMRHLNSMYGKVNKKCQSEPSWADWHFPILGECECYFTTFTMLVAALTM